MFVVALYTHRYGYNTIIRRWSGVQITYIHSVCVLRVWNVACAHRKKKDEHNASFNCGVCLVGILYILYTIHVFMYVKYTRNSYTRYRFYRFYHSEWCVTWDLLLLLIRKKNFFFHRHHQRINMIGGAHKRRQVS